MSGLVHDLLTRSAGRHGERTAIVDGPRSVTYADLEAQANRMSRCLLEHGVRQGDRVGLFLDKSVEAVVGIYAILKTGAAYVPFDPRSPSARLGYVAADAGIRCIVTGKEKQSAWQPLLDLGGPLQTLVVANAGSAEIETPQGPTVVSADEIDAQPAEPVAIDQTSADLAYILYTSGSTGVPKGVMLSHRNARAFVDWAVAEFGVGDDDRLSSHAPFHFDLSVFDLYAAASAGASVVLVRPEVSVLPLELTRFIQDASISIWYSVPSVLTMLVLRGKLDEADLRSLRAVLFAGEVFPTKHLSRLMELLPPCAFLQPLRVRPRRMSAPGTTCHGSSSIPRRRSRSGDRSPASTRTQPGLAANGCPRAKSGSCM